MHAPLLATEVTATDASPMGTVQTESPFGVSRVTNDWPEVPITMTPPSGAPAIAPICDPLRTRDHW